MATPINPFAAHVQTLVATALEMSPTLFPVGAPPKAAMGDLAVGCFPAAKEKRSAPAQIAAQVAKALMEGPLQSDSLVLEVTSAGPFVNFKIRPEALWDSLWTSSREGSSHVPTASGKGKTICIDYSSPNISKQLAYHHIRSTVIGHALVKIYRSLGYRVIGINHLGDWGTTHGMLIAAYKKWPPEGELTIDTLNGLYVKFRAEMKKDSTLEAEGRAWFAKLEQGDAEARKLWQHFKEVSWEEFQKAYNMLGITFEEVRGESEYVEAMPGVLAMLDEKGLSSVSEGALVVMLEEEGMPPLLLRKQDGATLYGTRDLAAAEYRWETYEFERNLYVVDRGQGLHFKQLFTTLDKAGFEWSQKCHHVPFGLVRLGGKKTGTRAGNVVLLKEVFAEASERARKAIAQNNPDWDEDRVAEVAPAVGIGAVVFANLMSQREKDVDFAWEDVLSASGDSGVYVQYAHARCCAVLRKGEYDAQLAVDFSLLDAPLEWSLGLALSQLGSQVARAAEHNDPHILSRYLLDVGAAVSGWYTSGNQDKGLRILCEDRALKGARLALARLARDVLAEGLGILGIQSPESM